MIESSASQRPVSYRASIADSQKSMIIIIFDRQNIPRTGQAGHSESDGL